MTKPNENLHAALIVAYKDIELLNRIISNMSNDFEFFIHINKRSLNNSTIIKEIKNLEKNNKIKLITTKYEFNWGGINHLYAIIHLSEESIKLEKYQYFHLISGQDFPVANEYKFREILSNSEKIHI